MSNEAKDLLLDAVRCNHVKKAKGLVNAFGLSFYPEFCQGYVLLRIAIEKGFLKLAKFLLSKGARTNNGETDKIGTPLHFAVGNSWDPSFVKLLLDKGADLKAKDGQGRTPLHVAAKAGLVHAVRFLTNKGAQINAIDNNEMTPLHLACLEGYERTVEHFLMFIRVVEESKISFLHLAVYSGNINILRLLIGKGLDLNMIAHSTCKNRFPTKNSSFSPEDIFGFTPLLLACKQGQFEMVQLLLQNGADMTIATLGHGYLPLHLASMCQSVSIAQLLLNKGADQNALSKNSLTPLLCACKAGSLELEKKTVEIVELLLSRSADVNSKDEDNKTALRIAVEKQCLCLVVCILRHNPDVNDVNNRAALKSALSGPGETSLNLFRRLREYGLSLPCEDTNDPRFLHSAVKKGSADHVRYLINNGADPDSVQDGTTPLHLAVQSDRNEIVKILLYARCNVNAKDKRRKTPIDYALSPNKLGGGVEAFKILLDNGACLKNADWFLREAVRLRNFDICKILIDQGVDVNLVDEKGMTALLYTTFDADVPPYRCVRKGLDSRYTREIAALLLGKGCDVNARSREGLTTLHGVASLGFEGMVNDLLKYGADVNISDDNGKTPLHLAAEKGRVKVVETLLKYGAKANEVDSKGNLPLHYAVLKSVKQEDRGFYLEVVKVLLSSVGAVVNQVNRNGSSPLHLAVRNMSLNILETLIKHGANVNVAPKVEPLESNLDDSEVFDEDEECNERNGYDEHNDYDEHYDYDEDDEYDEYNEGNEYEECSDPWMELVGQTPLHYAAKEGPGYEIFAAVLLKNGADVNARSISNTTPLHLASMKHEKMAELLLNNGANIEAICSHGLTPLHIAAAKGCPKVVETLLQFDAVIDQKDSFGQTALHLAVLKHRPRIVWILLEHGADFNLKTKRGETALHLAAIPQRKGEDYINPVLVVLVEHMIKLETAGFFESPQAVSQLYSSSSLDYLEQVRLQEFESACKEEFEKIKDSKLSRHVSLVDILNRKKNNLLLRNKSLLQNLESFNFKLIPIYGSVFECIRKEIRRRSELIVSGDNCLDSILKMINKLNGSHIPMLPSTPKDTIFSFLTNRDLKTFVSCLRGFNTCSEQ